MGLFFHIGRYASFLRSVLRRPEKASVFRRLLAEEMAAGMVLEVRAELAGSGKEAERAEELQTRLEAEVLQEEPKHFNDDDLFVEAVE